MKTTQILGDRERALLALYRAPVVLKKPHKDLLKTIWSFAQGLDGFHVRCFSCGKVFDFPGSTVHHCDGNVRHNEFENLDPACWDCNRREGWLVRKRQVAERRERKKEADAQIQTATQQLLPFADEQQARSHALRTKFNRVLYDPSDGLAKDEGYHASIKGLAKIMVHKVGVVRGKLGTSQTFEKYLKDDLAGLIWKSPDEDDLDVIERTSRPFPFPQKQRSGVLGH